MLPYLRVGWVELDRPYRCRTLAGDHHELASAKRLCLLLSPSLIRSVRASIG